MAFRINEIQKDVAAFLKDNYSSTAALPIFSAESQLRKTVGDAVHRTFREMLKANPKMREQAEKDGIAGGCRAVFGKDRAAQRGKSVPYGGASGNDREVCAAPDEVPGHPAAHGPCSDKCQFHCL